LSGPEPRIEQPADSPVRVVSAGFRSHLYRDFSFGTAVVFRVENISGRPIESYSVSCQSTDGLDRINFGYRPQEYLKPDQSLPGTMSIDSSEMAGVRLWVSDVRFSDGSTWHALNIDPND
jgi:hypothetical protein